MSLDAMSQPEVERMDAELLAAVPISGTIGNKSLRTRLIATGWTETDYWEVRNRLVDRGLLETGRGRGGSVRRASEGEDSEPTRSVTPAPCASPPEYPSERELYAPMAEVLRNHWAKDNRFDDAVVEITASQGARPTGGKWTRPDITLAGYKTLPYVPGRHFEVTSFEIKPAACLDVTVVYEALAHRRAATRSYVLLHVPDEERDGLEGLIAEIVLEAKRFGVGVIVAAGPGDYDSWEVLAEAVRHEPDPERLNDFLAQQVSQQFRERIIKWFK